MSRFSVFPVQRLYWLEPAVCGDLRRNGGDPGGNGRLAGWAKRLASRVKPTGRALWN